jgi:glycosyltransferase involved in cell wall biosynthesis
LQHVAGFHRTGGPATALRRTLESRLKKKYDFVVVSQMTPTNGLSFRQLYEFAEIVRAERPDIVHVRGLGGPGFHGSLGARLGGCARIVVSVHGFTHYAEISKPICWARSQLLGKIFEPASLLLASATYTVCQEAANVVRYARFTKKKHYGVIYNGVSECKRSCTSQQLRVSLELPDGCVVGLFVGRLVREKGIYELVEATKQLVQKNVNICVVCVGDGPEYSACLRIVEQQRLKKHIRLLGPRSDVMDLLGISDFFVLPSYYENASNAIMEALMCGRAVISTRTGGTPEIVEDEVCGLLVEPKDVVRLTEALERVVVNAGLRRKLANRARIVARERFGINDMTSRIGEVYDMLMRG